MATKVMLADNKPVTDEIIEAHLRDAGFLWMQPKIDGMRTYIGENAVPQTRSGKEWKHKPLRALAQAIPSLRGFDGEVVPGHTYHADSFREAMSCMRAENGTREFTFYVFDYVTMDNLGYMYRMAEVERILGGMEMLVEREEYHARLVYTPTVAVHTLKEVHDLAEQHIADYWEGSMLRRPDRAYKFGRATNRMGELIKLKRFEDAEAVVVGYEPWEQNNNPAELNDLGRTVRSSHQDGKESLERLGALHVELLTDRNIKFKIGVMAGITHTERDRLWADRDSLIGRICKFKHQGYSGGYDLPRSPVFLNWRSAAEF